ncbi:hypothetical protein MRB53_005896 [Persea americana]|uniref:Uncharacterized protein n=1 Tax=Persea americana TaxID=3435 RepID=A0ACC2MF59_PERAE|nr:hypothetical protein MRB53_005896 [Persea americana]
MEVQKGDQAAQAKIWSLIYGFSESLVLRCAVELGIADIIHEHGDTMSINQLASKIPVNSVNVDHLYRIMRFLVHMKLFSIQSVKGELRYGLEPAARCLVKGWDKCMVPSILSITDKDFMAPWHYIKESLGKDSPTAFEKALGMNIWDYMADNPMKNQLFNEGMACDSRLLTSALIQDCKEMFEGILSLVDVGGGTGTALRAIAKAFPHMECTVYDLPHVIADSPDYPEVARVPGDMFKSIPCADAIMMKCILHDWDDQECIRILKKCREAVPPKGGKVIIVDIVLDVESDSHYSNMRRCMDLDMMLNTGGKERTEEEWKKLIYDAGFTGYKIKSISAVQSVIEAYPY